MRFTDWYTNKRDTKVFIIISSSLIANYKRNTGFDVHVYNSTNNFVKKLQVFNLLCTGEAA